MSEPGGIAVLLVDDDRFVRAALRALLESAPEVAWAGEAENGAQAETVIVAERPDVVLMDIEMPLSDGITAIRRVRARMSQPPPMIVLSNHVADAHVLTALQAGAAGYLDKRAEPDQVVAAVLRAAAGEATLSPSVTRTMIEAVTAAGIMPRGDTSEWRGALTPREVEIAEAVAAGLSNQQIAVQLTMSLSTVKTNVSRILTKLGLVNRVQIALVVHGVTPREPSR